MSHSYPCMAVHKSQLLHPERHPISVRSHQKLPIVLCRLIECFQNSLWFRKSLPDFSLKSEMYLKLRLAKGLLAPSLHPQFLQIGALCLQPMHPSLAAAPATNLRSLKACSAFSWQLHFLTHSLVSRCCIRETVFPSLLPAVKCIELVWVQLPV